MANVIGVRFKSVGKVYYFDPKDIETPLYSYVVVETSRGIECGQVVMEKREISDEDIVKPLKEVIRAATKADMDNVAPVSYTHLNHKVFGKGEVIDIKNDTIKIKFDNYGEKNLSLRVLKDKNLLIF